MIDVENLTEKQLNAMAQCIKILLESEENKTAITDNSDQTITSDSGENNLTQRESSKKEGNT